MSMNHDIERIIEGFTESRVRKRLAQSLALAGDDAEAGLTSLVLTSFQLIGQAFYLAGIVDGRDGIPDEALPDRLADLADEMELAGIAASLQLKEQEEDRQADEGKG